MEALTGERRVKVFVIDDTVYDRHRSKKVELLSWGFDHVSGKSLKGFKMLTLGWDDGVSFVPLDFVLGAATDPSKRVCGVTQGCITALAAQGSRTPAAALESGESAGHLGRLSAYGQLVRLSLHFGKVA